MARLAGEWRRRTTRSPTSRSGDQGREAIAGKRYTIARVHRWSELAERVAATTRTSEKTGLLAGYLPTLDPAELRVAAVFLSGRPFPEADQRSTGLGWATIAGVVAAVAGTPAGALGAAYDRSSDLGPAVF